MTFRLTRSVMTIGVTIAAIGPISAGRAARAAADTPTPQARPAALLSRGRAAIGPVESLKSLSAVGTRKSMLGTSAGAPEPYELHFVLPDRFVQFVKTVSQSSDIRTYVWGFNGTTALNGIRSAEPMLTVGRETNPTLEQRLFARLLLGWLLVDPSYLNVEYRYAGEAEAQDGRKAFVIEARGDKDFSVRLFLDESTCRPLMLAYKAAGAGPALRTANGTRPSDNGGKKTSGSVQTGAGESDAILYFSDVRAIGPLQLAHVLIDSRDGRTTQQIQFSKLTVNPDLKPALFTQP